jgi:hypothetical protein
VPDLSGQRLDAAPQVGQGLRLEDVLVVAMHDADGYRALMRCLMVLRMRRTRRTPPLSNGCAATFRTEFSAHQHPGPTRAELAEILLEN